MDQSTGKGLVTTTVRLSITEFRPQRFPKRPLSPIHAPIGSLYMGEYWSEEDSNEVQGLYSSFLPWSDEDRPAMLLAARRPRLSLSLEEIKRPVALAPQPSLPAPPAMTPLPPPVLTPVQPPFRSANITVVTNDDLNFTINKGAAANSKDSPPSEEHEKMTEEVDPSEESAQLAHAVHHIAAVLHARRQHMRRQRQILMEKSAPQCARAFSDCGHGFS